VDVNGINLVAGERYHLLYHEVYGIRAVSLRLTNTYGPHLLIEHDRQGFITTFIRQALDGKPIQVFGDGSQLRDFTYVSDAVDAFLAVGVTRSTYGKAFNVGGTEPVQLLEVAEICQALGGVGGSIETVPWPPDRKRIDIGSIYIDHSRLTDAVGWTPRVSLRDGLAETFAFYREHGDHYRA
jgi:UDP-glucose 4-epimerase